MTGAMRLRAVDAADLRVVSALLQDAIIPIADMAYLPDEQQFVFLASRFQWEGNLPDGGPTPDEGGEGQARIQCAVHFSGVEAVRRRGVDLCRRGAFLSLLALEPVEGALLLRLSGGADIRLEGRAIECRLSDQGEAWPAQSRPQHRLG
ncbi:DUF2948 family protein [Niveispirillum sp.]|uniref:DUF2948 family protein n=1 Tax=Niveispirillum sp. TaxID=1917217 RepID=UPI001B771AE7|nr:DUF2948 family protein [Niveispirillum sp.]MBP7338899.1 DUF2948 family protein [Niveispirillum sp.]